MTRTMGQFAAGILRKHVTAALLFLWFLCPSLLAAASDLAIPKPTDVLLPPPPPPALEPSVVNVTIGGSLRDMMESIDSLIPVHHRHEEEWIPGKRTLNGMPFEYQYYLWRGPLRFNVMGDRFITEFPDIRYRVRVRIQEPGGTGRIAECGYGPDAHMRMRVEAASEMHWRQDWVLQTTTQFGAPQFVTPCRLDPVGLDVTELLNDWFAERLPRLASVIDQTFIKRREAKKRAQIVWETFQEPMQLRSGTWLRYRPRDPRAGSLKLDRNESVQTIVSMAFDPAIVVGTKPLSDRTPLPPLQTGPAAREGFHLAVPMLVPYEALNRQLEKEVVGQEIIPPVGSSIRITGVRAYGSGDKLISEVTLTGGVNGRLYLQGKPAMAPDGHTLEFRQFDYTLETSSALANFANRVMYDTLRNKIVENSRLEVGDRIETLRRQVEREMNRELGPGMRLDGEVTGLAPLGVYPVPGGVELQFAVDGALHLAFQ